MVQGDVWEIYIPSDLAYGMIGNNQRPRVDPGEALIVKLELVKMQPSNEPSLRCNLRTKEYCNEEELEYIAKLDRLRKKQKLDVYARAESGKLVKQFGDPSETRLDEKDYAWILRRTQLLSQAMGRTIEHGEGTCKKGARPQLPIFFGYDLFDELNLHVGSDWKRKEEYDKHAQKGEV